MKVTYECGCNGEMTLYLNLLLPKLPGHDPNASVTNFKACDKHFEDIKVEALEEEDERHNRWVKVIKEKTLGGN